MVDPVHPIVSVKNGFLETPIFSTTDFPSKAFQNNEASVVIGQIRLDWKVLRSGTRGLDGVVQDIKSLCQEVKCSRFTDNIEEPRQLRQDFMTMYASAVKRRQLDREREKLQLDIAAELMKKNNQALNTEKQIRKTFTKRWSDDDIAVDAVSSAAIPLVPQKSILKRYQEDGDSSERQHSSKVKILPMTNTVINRWQAEEEKKNILMTLIAEQQASSKVTQQQRENGVKQGFSGYLNQTCKAILSKLQYSSDFILYNSEGLRPHRTLRNITRRSHAICSLLFFPAAVNMLSGGHLPELLRLPRKQLNEEKFHTRSHKKNNDDLPFAIVSPPDGKASLKRTTSFSLLPHIETIKNKEIPSAIDENYYAKTNSVAFDDSNITNKNIGLDGVLKNKNESLFFAESTNNFDRLPYHIDHEDTYDLKNRLIDSNITPEDTSSISSISFESSFGSQDNLEETDFYSLAFGCGLPQIWEPRLLLYGGAIQESLDDSKCNALNWLSDFPLYTLVPDEPYNSKLVEFWSGLVDPNYQPIVGSKSFGHELSDLGSGKLSDIMANNLNADVVKILLKNIESSDNLKTILNLSEKTLQNLSSADFKKETFQELEKYGSNISSLLIGTSTGLPSTDVIKNDAKTIDKPVSLSLSETPKNFIFQLNSSLFNDNKSIFSMGLSSCNRDLQKNESTETTGCLNWKNVLTHCSGITKESKIIQTEIGTPPARFGSASVTYRGKMYVFGGAGIAEWREPVLMNDLWVLSPRVEEEEHLTMSPEFYGSDATRVSGYRWQELPLQYPKRPPPCAFHLAAVNDGFMYVLISDCTVPEPSETPYGWIQQTVFNAAEASNQRIILRAEYERAKEMYVNPNVLKAYKKRLKRNNVFINQIWRIDLNSSCPFWEEFDVTISKNMPMMVSGGITMTFYNGRLFVYGTVTGHPHVAIGVLDVTMRMWVTWVKLPGAPVWVTSVLIGKLWLLFGLETWGIFNLETFEWRYTAAPSQAEIRYGCNSVWLPPYLPFPPSFEISPLVASITGLGLREQRTMRRTDLSAQYFWLTQQGRRYMDHAHTILLVGGFDRKTGSLSNQVDQIVVFLPPDLAQTCFFPVWREADLFYASLFGMHMANPQITSLSKRKIKIDLKDQNSQGRCDISNLNKLLDDQEQQDIIYQLQQEIKRLKTAEEERIDAEDLIFRKLQLRFFARQRQLLQKLHQKDDEINHLRIRFEKERLLTCQLLESQQSTSD